MPQDRARRDLKPEQYEQIKKTSLSDQDKVLDDAFNLPPTWKGTRFPIPPTPYPFGKNPVEVDPKAMYDTSRFFSLYPGMQEKVSHITARPLSSYSKMVQDEGYGPEDASRLNIMGMYEPETKSIFLRNGTGLLQGNDNPESTLAHEYSHERGFGHPDADIIGTFYNKYIDRINERNDRDIYLPPEPKKKVGIGPSSKVKLKK